MAAEATNQDSGFTDNWQNCKSLSECNLHMLTSEDSCDVNFRVGKQEKIIRAHRYVLISRSCVFHAMLCGHLAEKDDINIPDVEPSMFYELLRFLYTNASSPEPGNVTGLLYLAKKYAVGGLERLCVEYLETSLSADNACVILEQAHIFEEKKLFDTAMKIIAENGEKCLASEGFTELSYECFHKMMSSDDLTVKPEQMFTAAVTWAEEECRRHGREVTPDNLRSFLGESLYAISFHKMDQKHYVNTVTPKQILTKDEDITIMRCMLCPDQDPSPFKHRTIKHDPLQVLLFYNGQKRKRCSANTFSNKVLFLFDQDVVISGVYIFVEDPAEKMFTLKIQRSPSLWAPPYPFLVNGTYTCSSTDLQDTAAIFLKDPVLFKKNTEYYTYIESKNQEGRKFLIVGDDERSTVTLGQCTFSRKPPLSDLTDNMDIICGFALPK